MDIRTRDCKGQREETTARRQAREQALAELLHPHQVLQPPAGLAPAVLERLQR